MKARYIVAVIVGLLVSAFVIAHPSGGGMMGGGYGPGYGMMGGGYGSGYGMMGGHGYGMMGGNYGNIPDLTKEQESKISAIQNKYRDKQWTLMRKMHDLRWDAYRDGRYDEQAERKSYREMDKLRHEMFEHSIQYQKEIDGVLTDKQRKMMTR